MSHSRFSTHQLALAGIIAGIYAGLTLLLPIRSIWGYSSRIAEAMTVLPFLCPAAIPGLTIGCFLANLLGSPMGEDWWFRHGGHAAGGPVDIPAEKPLSGAFAASHLQRGDRRSRNRLVFSGGHELLGRLRPECIYGRNRRAGCVLFAGTSSAEVGRADTCAAEKSMMKKAVRPARV